MGGDVASRPQTTTEDTIRKQQPHLRKCSHNPFREATHILQKGYQKTIKDAGGGGVRTSGRLRLWCLPERLCRWLVRRQWVPLSLGEIAFVWCKCLCRVTPRLSCLMT